MSFSTPVFFSVKVLQSVIKYHEGALDMTRMARWSTDQDESECQITIYCILRDGSVAQVGGRDHIVPCVRMGSGILSL